jgi:alpha,alpha-trehalase
MILADYRMQKSQTSFDLRHFVELNFTLPRENDQYVPPKDKRCASISTACGRY